MDINLFQKIMLIGDPEALGYVGIYQWFVQAHIAFGVISVITATLILALTKGTERHKAIGKPFVAVMMGNFLLAIPLGVFGNFAVGDPANILTALGGPFAGVFVWSGFRTMHTAQGEVAWHDKAMFGIGVLSAALYFYFGLLMLIGTDLFGLSAITMEREQFQLADNVFPLSGLSVAIITFAGTPFAVIAAQNFFPLFLGGGMLAWVCYTDWQRFTGRRKFNKKEIIHQHLARLLMGFSASVTASILNMNMIPLWISWSLPQLLALALIAYFKLYGFNKWKLSNFTARPKSSAV